MALLRTDLPPKAYNRKALCLELPYTTLAAISNGNHAVNNFQASGCGYGKIAIVEGLINSVTPAVELATIFMKITREPDSAWYPLTQSATVPAVTPSAYSNAQGNLRSDRKPLAQQGDAINSYAIPMVDVADLANIGHPINQYHLSGKNRYSFVIGKDETDGYVANWTYRLYMATGLEPESAWVQVCTAFGTITPTGTEMAVDGNLRSDRKRTAYNATALHIGFPVFTATDMADATAGCNVYGKMHGATIMVVDDLDSPTTFKLAMATDYLPTSTWKYLDGLTAAVTPA